jgi:adenine-specific DNA-methyltransferase
MKTRTEVSPEKLRGGFYSPDPLVDRCLDRVAELVRGRHGLRLLEPSAGDGAFIRGLSRSIRLSASVDEVVAIEPIASEAAKCVTALEERSLRGRVLIDSAIGWSASCDETFDCAVGNPPYVRFQFVSDEDKRSMPRLERRAGVPFTGVSNLWLPVLIGSLSRLKIGGAFAFIIPTECFTGLSAGALRTWLVRNAESLRFDLFPPGSFPGVLQEVTILSGQRCATRETGAQCEIREHGHDGARATTTHLIRPNPEPWTRYLLTKPQVDAFEEASRLADVWTINTMAKFEVAAVTGANDFFSVDAATVEQYDLARWTTPLLPRIRHATGLRYTESDQADTEAAGAKAFLLDFSAERPDPSLYDKAATYLATGVLDELPTRYKCRIREPWYRVPFIRAGRLMMSKRSHHYPRVILNDAGVVTTDTIYRGTMIGFFDGREADLAAGFHNSLTLLSAEIEGRSFGGGVLELVPSEVGRLVVPMPDGFASDIDRLDELSRSSTNEAGQDLLIRETDLLLTKADIGLTADLLERLAEARLSLLQRRLDRNASS